MDLNQSKTVASAESGAQDKLLVRPRHLGWLALILVCVVASLVSLFVSPLQVIGAVLVCLIAVICFKRPFVGLLIYLVVFLLRPAELYPVLGPLHIERLVGILVLIASVVGHKINQGRLQLPRDNVTTWLLVFFAVTVVSWSYSTDQMRTYLMVERFFKLLIFYLLIVLEVTNRKRFDAFVAVYLFMIFLDTFLSFRDYYGGGARYRMSIYRADGRTSAGGDPNALAATLACTLPLLVAFFRLHRNLFLRLGLVVFAGLLILMISNTGSRSGLLGLLAALGIMVFYTRQRLIAAAAVLLLLGAGWVVMPDQYKARYHSIIESERDVNVVSSGRVDVWENGLRMFVAHPITGVGAGAFLTANASGEYGPPIQLQAHSLYIQLLATVGLPGTIIWFLFLAGVGRRCLAKPKGDQPAALRAWSLTWRQGFVAALGALLMAGVFGHSLDRYTWYMLAALSLKLIAFDDDRAKDGRDVAAL